jgi:hypothetical protein
MGRGGLKKSRRSTYITICFFRGNLWVIGGPEYGKCNMHNLQDIFIPQSRLTPKDKPNLSFQSLELKFVYFFLRNLYLIFLVILLTQYDPKVMPVIK